MQIYYLLLERQFVIQVNIKYNKIDISNWGEEEEIPEIKNKYKKVIKELEKGEE